MMLKPPMNELLAQDDKPVSMALREVADGKCTPQDEEDEAV